MAGRSADRRTERSHASSRRRKKGEPRAEPEVDAPKQERPVPTAGTEERALLVGVSHEGPEDRSVDDVLDELSELARTAGARVVGRLVQRRSSPHSSTYLGSGKLEEVRDLCREAEANLVVADTDLSPAQVRNMEEILGLRVIDRSELIIDIFARHARSQQSRLQVELAQLQYQAPRLKRMWTHLSRITGAGGIGSRGPGEKQIEVDRRLIQKRIQVLREELSEIETRRVRQARSREETFRVALVGYTNAGKSTLMRSLTGADVYVADKLFATLDTRTRRWRLSPETEVLLSDTVGFIEKLPHHLVASFHATLEEVREASLLLHVVDGGDAEAERRIEVVRSVLKDLGCSGIEECLVLNKIDLIDDPVEITILAKKLGADLCVSAANGTGLKDLVNRVARSASAAHGTYEFRIPVTDGKLIAHLRRTGKIQSESYSGSLWITTATVPDRFLGPLRPYMGPIPS